MKIAHVCNYAPGLSGLYGSVRELHLAEQRLKLDARIVDDSDGKTFFGGYGKDGIVPADFSFCDEADIICWHHAVHDDWLNEPHRNVILWLHGTPEYNLMTELHSNDKALSLIIGAAGHKIPKAYISMWQRHVPMWESLLRTKVHFLPCWVDLEAFRVVPRSPEKGTIRIAMMDYWRLTREPFGLLMAIDWLRRNSGKQVKVDVWGLLGELDNTWKGVLQWLVEDDIVTLKGNTDKPMEDIYQQADLVLTMSTEETRVVREAYACGVPVVCGRGGLTFTDYSADCIIPENLGSIVQKCHDDLVKDPTALRQRLRKIAETRFRPEIAARKAKTIFEQVLREHGSVNLVRHKVNGKRMVASVHETADTIRDRMLQNKPVIYSRFGDGTLLLMNGHEGWDYWHHRDAKLQEELLACFKGSWNGYLLGCSAGQENEGRMRPGLFARHESDGVLREIALTVNPGRTYENAVALTYLSVFQVPWFADFLNRCIRPKKVCLICNEKVAASPLVQQVLNVSHFIVVPEVDAYQAIEDIEEEVFKAVATHDVILSAAGPLSNVLARRLCRKRLIRKGRAFLDIGSIADGLAGIPSHSWIRERGEQYRKNYAMLYTTDVPVDMVILTHGNPEVTIRCFRSIQEHTKNAYQVFWFDNGSSAADLERMKEAAKGFPDCELLRSEENLGFSRAVNQALLRSLANEGSQHVLLLNNDIVVTPGWLERLVGAMETGDCAAIGPLTSEGNPHSLEALRKIAPDLPTFNGESPEIRARKLWEKFGYSSFRSGNMVSFFCCLLRKEAVRKTGALDENLFCYGEDNDYCLRLSRLGYRLGISLGSYVHHDHRITANAMGADWVKTQQEVAVKYLTEKWKDVPPNVPVGPFWSVS